MKSKLIKSLDMNLSKVLMVMGVAGIFITTYFAVEETFKAVEDIQETKRTKEDETGDTKLSPKEVGQIIVKNYKKTGTAAIATAVCNITAFNEESRKGVTAVGTAKALYDIVMDDRRYQAKLEDQVGPKKVKTIKEGLAIEAAEAELAKYKNGRLPHMEYCGRGTHLFYDEVQNRFFMSDLETVKAGFIQLYTFTYDENESTINDLNGFWGISETAMVEDTVVYYPDDVKEFLRPDLNGFIGTTKDLNGEPCFCLRYPKPWRPVV